MSEAHEPMNTMKGFQLASKGFRNCYALYTSCWGESASPSTIWENLKQLL